MITLCLFDRDLVPERDESCEENCNIPLFPTVNMKLLPSVYSLGLATTSAMHDNLVHFRIFSRLGSLCQEDFHT